MRVDPPEATIMSVDGSIGKYLIMLLLVPPSGVEYCHIDVASVSSSDTMLAPLYRENAYRKLSLLPNTNPR